MNSSLRLRLGAQNTSPARNLIDVLLHKVFIRFSMSEVQALNYENFEMELQQVSFSTENELFYSTRIFQFYFCDKFWKVTHLGRTYVVDLYSGCIFNEDAEFADLSDDNQKFL